MGQVSITRICVVWKLEKEKVRLEISSMFAQCFATIRNAHVFVSLNYYDNVSSRSSYSCCLGYTTCTLSFSFHSIK